MDPSLHSSYKIQEQTSQTAQQKVLVGCSINGIRQETEGTMGSGDATRKFCVDKVWILSSHPSVYSKPGMET